MSVLHRRYEVHPRWVGTRWELHISGVGMTTTMDLSRARQVASTYISVDLGPHALDHAEVVLLTPFPPAYRADRRLRTG